MVKSIDEFGVCNPKVVLLVFAGELIAAGIDPRSPVFNLDEPQPDGVHFYAIVGAHTISAFKIKLKQKPRNLQYKFISCRLIVCDDTPLMCRLAVKYGAMDNQIGDKSKAMTTWDTVWLLQQQKNTVDSNHSLSAKEKKAAHSACRQDVADISNTKPATFGTLCTVAKLPHVIFDIIQSIMTGETGNEKLKIPSGIGAFKDLSGVPEEEVEKWLTNVISGVSTLSAFTKKVDRYKKRKRIQANIVEYIGIMRPGLIIDTYASVVVHFPQLGVKSVFDNLVSWCGAIAKEALSNAVKREVLAIISAEEKKQAGLEVVSCNEHHTPSQRHEDMNNIHNISQSTLRCLPIPLARGSFWSFPTDVPWKCIMRMRCKWPTSSLPAITVCVCVVNMLCCILMCI